MKTSALILILLFVGAYPIYKVKSFGSDFRFDSETSECFNDNGAIAGWVMENGLERAATIRFGAVQKLPQLGPSETCTYNRSAALGINAHAVVVGWSSGTEPGCRVVPTLWVNDVAERIAVGETGVAWAINDNGLIAGVENWIRGWVYDGTVTWLEPQVSNPSGDFGSEVSIHALNNDGVVGGDARTDGGRFATIWRNGEPTFLNDGEASGSTVWGLNDRGQAVGAGFQVRNGSVTQDESYVWNIATGAVTTLNIGQAIGPSYRSAARAINNRGEVAGTMRPAGGLEDRAYYWNGGPTVRALNALTVGMDAISGNRAAAINRAGTILGSGQATEPVLLWTKTGGTL